MSSTVAGRRPVSRAASPTRITVRQLRPVPASRTSATNATLLTPGQGPIAPRLHGEAGAALPSMCSISTAISSDDSPPAAPSTRRPWGLAAWRPASFGTLSNDLLVNASATAPSTPSIQALARFVGQLSRQLRSAHTSSTTALWGPDPRRQRPAPRGQHHRYALTAPAGPNHGANGLFGSLSMLAAAPDLTIATSHTATLHAKRRQRPRSPSHRRQLRARRTTGADDRDRHAAAAGLKPDAADTFSRINGWSVGPNDQTITATRNRTL